MKDKGKQHIEYVKGSNDCTHIVVNPIEWDDKVRILSRASPVDRSDDFKSKWIPKVRDIYYTPFYLFSEWTCEKMALDSVTSFHNRMFKKGEAFQTEAECKAYIDSKGWVNGN